MQRIYFDGKFGGNSATISDKETARRLDSVLRLRPGDRFLAFDSTGSEYLAEITAIGKSGVSVGFVEKVSRDTGSPRTLHLYPSLFKRQRFEWMLEKCVELGVKDFFPVASAHSVVKEHGDEPNDRWKKIAVSATEQSERMKVPEISAAQALAGAVESASGEIWVAAERDKGQMLSDAARTASAEEISLFIGPEGGWSEEEMSMFREKGARLLSLGSRILRAETACVAACSIILIG